MSYDTVNHPQHYTAGEAICPGCDRPIECIDVVRHLGFNEGNAIKYIWRYKGKNGAEDIKKAIWYLTDLLDKIDKV